MIKIKISKDPKTTAREFANFLLTEHTKKENLNIALSGGSTPKLLFDIMAGEFAREFDWSKINFYWGDERCVPPTDTDSNYKMTYDHLIGKVKVPKSNIHRIWGENNPEEEAVRYGKEIMNHLPLAKGLPVFDIVLLGLGTDGHTASIFPHQIELLNDPHICAVGTNPDSGQQRITLTGPVINNATTVCFLITGSAKAQRVDEIYNQKGNYTSYPAAHIAPKSGILLWYLDESAGTKL